MSVPTPTDTTRITQLIPLSTDSQNEPIRSGRPRGDQGDPVTRVELGIQGANRSIDKASLDQRDIDVKTRQNRLDSIPGTQRNTVLIRCKSFFFKFGL